MMTDKEFERRTRIRQRAEDIVRQLGEDDPTSLTYIECLDQASNLLKHEIGYYFKMDKEYVF